MAACGGVVNIFGKGLNGFAFITYYNDISAACSYEILNIYLMNK